MSKLSPRPASPGHLPVHAPSWGYAYRDPAAWRGKGFSKATRPARGLFRISSQPCVPLRVIPERRPRLWFQQTAREEEEAREESRSTLFQVVKPRSPKLKRKLTCSCSWEAKGLLGSGMAGSRGSALCSGFPLSTSLRDPLRGSAAAPKACGRRPSSTSRKSLLQVSAAVTSQRRS